MTPEYTLLQNIEQCASLYSKSKIPMLMARWYALP